MHLLLHWSKANLKVDLRARAEGHFLHRPPPLLIRTAGPRLVSSWRFVFESKTKPSKQREERCFVITGANTTITYIPERSESQTCVWCYQNVSLILIHLKLLRHTFPSTDQFKISVLSCEEWMQSFLLWSDLSYRTVEIKQSNWWRSNWCNAEQTLENKLQGWSLLLTVDGKQKTQQYEIRITDCTPIYCFSHICVYLSAARLF